MASEKTNSSQPCQRKKGDGAHSIAGKAISSQNAVKTGIDAKSEVMRCESRDEYEALIAEYYAATNPPSPKDGASWTTSFRLSGSAAATPPSPA